ncbi:MAG: ribonuclease III, partial [Pyrinomonadaceae bacterium]
MKIIPDLAIEELEKAIAYQFTDKQLLAQAVTHRSWAHERASRGSEVQTRQLHNEALEFVGDSVLGLI